MSIAEYVALNVSGEFVRDALRSQREHYSNPLNNVGSNTIDELTEMLASPFKSTRKIVHKARSLFMRTSYDPRNHTGRRSLKR